MRKFVPVEGVNLNEVVCLLEEQARARYNIAAGSIKECANKCGANIYIGKKRLYNKIILDEYFTKIAE